MRLGIFGIWIVLISIVKRLQCQFNESSGCYDQVMKLTAEVSPFIQSTICADNSPASLVLDSPRGFWFNNAEGFCTSINFNTGFIELSYLVTSPNLSVQLMKHSRTLDAAKVTLSIKEEVSATHLVTLWGHQNTRFVLKVVRTCNNVETTSAAPITVPVDVTQANLPQSSQQTTPKTTRPTATPRFDHSTVTDPTTRKQTTGNKIRNDTTTQNIITTPTQSYSVEIAKIAWMESKRIEFEKKMESLRYYSGENSSDARATDYFDGTKASKTTSLATSLSTERLDVYQNSRVADSDSIIPSTITVRDYMPAMKSTTYVMLSSNSKSWDISLNVKTHNMIQPTSVINDVVTVSQDSVLISRDEVIHNITIQPSVPDFPSSSLSTGPAAFLPIYETTTQQSLDSSEINTKTNVLITTPAQSHFPSAIIPSESSSFLSEQEMESTIITHPISHLYSSQTDVVSSSSIVNLPSLHTTNIPTSYSKTPTLSPAITDAHVFITTGNTTKLASTVYDMTTTSIENATVPVKKAGNNADGETFWPVVAALVVGIPSVLVFGIAIVVIHRRRSPVARKIFAMRSFSNLSTPSSSLPGYTNISSKRNSPSQSSV